MLGSPKNPQSVYAVEELLSKPQLNHNSTQPNITLSWVRHENDFAHHPPTHTNSMLAISQLLLTRF